MDQLEWSAELLALGRIIAAAALPLYTLPPALVAKLWRGSGCMKGAEGEWWRGGAPGPWCWSDEAYSAE